MYILSGDKKQIVNSEYVERFCISEKDDAALIVLSYSNTRPAVTLARYKNLEEAQSVLMELMLSISGGQLYFSMPESRLYAEEQIVNDARIKRRGKS